MAIRCLIALLKGVASEDFVQIPHGDNTAVALLTAENGELHVEYFNDNTHLPQTLSPFSGQTWWKRRSGSDTDSLRYEPYDLENGRELYLRCYRDAWQIAHGSLTGFDEDACWRGAVARAVDSPESLLAAYRGPNFAGILALDERRGRSSGKGWISFCYITPENRGCRFGIQLIGSAVARYRALGRKSLCLTVAQGNPARGFYEKAGFVVKTTEVLAIPVANRPGGLAQLLETLKDCQVEYMYAFASEVHDHAVMVFRFADPDKALEVLKAAHEDIIRAAELFTLD
jgi:probable phosphoglycerate mutase